MISLSTMPDEMLINIMEYLDLASLIRLSAVDNRFSLLTEERKVWREIIRQYFPYLLEVNPDECETDPKALFIKERQLYKETYPAIALTEIFNALKGIVAINTTHTKVLTAIAIANGYHQQYPLKQRNILLIAAKQAARNGNINILKDLISKCSFYRKTPEIYAAAASTGQLVIMKYFEENNRDMHKIKGEAFVVACRKGFNDVIKHYLEQQPRGTSFFYIDALRRGLVELMINKNWAGILQVVFNLQKSNCQRLSKFIENAPELSKSQLFEKFTQLPFEKISQYKKKAAVCFEPTFSQDMPTRDQCDSYKATLDLSDNSDLGRVHTYFQFLIFDESTYIQCLNAACDGPISSDLLITLFKNPFVDFEKAVAAVTKNCPRAMDECVQKAFQTNNLSFLQQYYSLVMPHSRTRGLLKRDWIENNTITPLRTACHSSNLPLIDFLFKTFGSIYRSLGRHWVVKHHDIFLQKFARAILLSETTRTWLKSEIVPFALSHSCANGDFSLIDFLLQNFPLCMPFPHHEFALLIHKGIKEGNIKLLKQLKKHNYFHGTALTLVLELTPHHIDLDQAALVFVLDELNDDEIRTLCKNAVRKGEYKFVKILFLEFYNYVYNQEILKLIRQNWGAKRQFELMMTTPSSNGQYNSDSITDDLMELDCEGLPCALDMPCLFSSKPNMNKLLVYQKRLFDQHAAVWKDDHRLRMGYVYDLFDDSAWPSYCAMGELSESLSLRESEKGQIYR
jgi:hypothetical protein